MYSIYLVRAVVSLMLAVFMLFVRVESYLPKKYYYAHIGVALAALLDFGMDIWGCWMIANRIDIFAYHWVWFIVYYIEWTVLGFCVLKMVESKHRFYWFTPLLLYYVIADSIAYRKHIDDIYAGTQNENLHELSYSCSNFYLLYILLTVADLAIFYDSLLDAIVVSLSTVAVVILGLRILNLKPAFPTFMPIYHDNTVDDQTEATPFQSPASPDDNIESRILAWESRPDKPYCNEDVSLYKVADELRVSPRILSSYINSVRMVNFNIWINTLRVNEIKRLIRENPKIDLYEIMAASGFQSRASLSRAVKYVTGLTITQLKGQSF